jgi:hypothetical protein
MKTLLLQSKVFYLLAIGLLGGGCGQVISVTATEDICRKSVEVHLVGVNRFEKDRWDRISMSEYWQPENQLRKSAKDYTYAIKFGRKSSCEVVLDKKAEEEKKIRSEWKGRQVEYIFVLADLPGIFPDQDGNADARRLRLPAPGSKCWRWNQSKINIRIESSNIVALTIPKSRCK